MGLLQSLVLESWPVFYPSVEARLHEIICNNDKDALQKLLATEGGERAIQDYRSDTSQTTFLMSLLDFSGSLSLLGVLLRRRQCTSEYLDLQDSRGRTAIMHAALYKRWDCLVALADAGARLDHYDRNGDDVVILAFDALLLMPQWENPEKCLAAISYLLERRMGGDQPGVEALLPGQECGTMRGPLATEADPRLQQLGQVLHMLQEVAPDRAHFTQRLDDARDVVAALRAEWRKERRRQKSSVPDSAASGVSQASGRRSRSYSFPGT